MTEDEAKQKWCPFVRVYSVSDSDGANGSWNRHQRNGHDETRCIGSECMAWRWNPDPDPLLNLPPHGRCGLAQ